MDKTFTKAVILSNGDVVAVGRTYVFKTDSKVFTNDTDGPFKKIHTVAARVIEIGDFDKITIDASERFYAQVYTLALKSIDSATPINEYKDKGVDATC